MDYLLLRLYSGNWQFSPLLHTKISKDLALECLDRLQRAPTAILERLQARGLSSLLEKAKRASPAWKTFLASYGLGDLPDGDLRRLLRALPVLDKIFYKEHPELGNSISFVRFGTYFTSGSSGIPFVMRLDEVSCFWRYLYVVRGNEWVGWTSRDPFLRIVRSSYPDPIQPFAGRDVVFVTWEEGAARMAAVGHAQDQRPAVLYGFAEYFRKMKRVGDTRGLPPLRAVIVTGEPLHEIERRELEDFFATPVYMSYSSREFGRIAQECTERSGYHVNAERFIVEVLDPQGRNVADGQEGRIVITDTKNFAMPFVRFDIGDDGYLARTPCACGRTLPRLFLSGRNTFRPMLEDGRTIHPNALFTVLNNASKHILRYQIVQGSAHDFAVLIRPLPGFSSDMRAKIEQGLQRVVGRRASVRVDISDGKNFIVTNGKILPFVLI